MALETLNDYLLGRGGLPFLKCKTFSLFHLICFQITRKSLESNNSSGPRFDRIISKAPPNLPPYVTGISASKIIKNIPNPRETKELHCQSLIISSNICDSPKLLNKILPNTNILLRAPLNLTLFHLQHARDIQNHRKTLPFYNPSSKICGSIFPSVNFVSEFLPVSILKSPSISSPILAQTPYSLSLVYAHKSCSISFPNLAGFHYSPSPFGTRITLGKIQRPRRYFDLHYSPPKTSTESYLMPIASSKAQPKSKFQLNSPLNLTQFHSRFISSGPQSSRRTPEPNNPPPKTSSKFRPKYRRKMPNRPLDLAYVQQALSQLPPRFTPEDLLHILSSQTDPLACLHIFDWASRQPRFKHDETTYSITIKKLGSSKLYDKMDTLVDQVLANPSLASEPVFNTIIYLYTEGRKLMKAIRVYKHMRNSKNCKPSLRTYNLLFTSLLSRGCNTYISHMYMETIRCLFKQMVNDGIQPDVLSLNSMIKGYSLSLHMNDALRIFHQMPEVYNRKPNAHSFDYLIHGLCAQGRSNNAFQLYREMLDLDFVPSSKAYNSLVNCLALAGETKESVNLLLEMNLKGILPDFVTYQTVIDEICRQDKVSEAKGLLKELQDKDFVDGVTYRRLHYHLQDRYGDLEFTTDRNGVH
ncbi:hypothetical protein AMTRI_Chr01g102570 [Amborella trichopoda]